MLIRQRFIPILLLFVVSLGRVVAQEAPASVDPTATLAVTAAASGERIRFTAPGAVVQMRLEVFAPSGEKVLDSGDNPGNVLDWRILEQQGALYAEASYLCVVTVRDVSNRLSQRHGIIALTGGLVTLRTAESDHLTPAQVMAREARRPAQALVAPADYGDALTILSADATPALTVTTHDGRDGQVTSIAGPLTFRTGDIFSGEEKEQMRITPAGQVGIGTTMPQATLDVAGTLRARGGIKFDDGSMLTSTGRVDRAGTSDEETPQPLVAGTGTTNRIARWLDNSGTLGDSSLTDIGGNIGLGVTNPGDLLDIAGAPNAVGRSGIRVRTTASFGNATLFFDNDRGNFASYGGLLTGGSTNPNLFFGVTRADKTFLIADGPTSLGLGIGTLVSRPVIFGTANAERMRIDSVGNVGIGTSSPNPATRLDVAGDINTSTQYRIGGNRVFSIAGPGNTFAGFEAGLANTTGGGNSFFGSAAGARNTTADGNSFFGAASGQNNTTGPGNSFFGNGAGLTNSTGAENSFFGASAGLSNTTGNSNSFFGKSAGLSNTTGNSNAFFGASAGATNTTGGSSSFFGSFAGAANTTGNSNAFFGARAGAVNTTGGSNSFFGSRAGESNTTGVANAFFGTSAGQANTTGGSNSFFGAGAGESNTTGGSNSFFGESAGQANTTGILNAFFGSSAGFSNTTGTGNSFFGGSAGQANTTGAANTFFGSFAGTANTSGAFNSFFGRNAGTALTTGLANIVIGNSAGGSLTTGNNNIYLGSSPGANESNTIRIGTGGVQTTAFIAGISGNSVAAASGTTVLVDAGGRLGTILSSRRFKQDIRTMGNASGKLMQLRPVTFLYRPEVVEGEQTLQYGLIAEEVAKIYPDLVQYAPDGQPQTVRYHLLNPMLLNEVQKQRRQIESQEHHLKAQTQRITIQAQQLQSETQQMARQEQQISSLETRLRRLETGARRRPRIRRR